MTFRVSDNAYTEVGTPYNNTVMSHSPSSGSLAIDPLPLDPPITLHDFSV